MSAEIFGCARVASVRFSFVGAQALVLPPGFVDTMIASTLSARDGSPGQTGASFSRRAPLGACRTDSEPICQNGSVPRIGSPNAVLAPWPGKSSCAPEPDPATTADILSQTVADLCGTGGTRGTGGIQELRRQLAQARTINEELRTLIEELRQQIATEALRRVEQENLLQQTLRAIQTNGETPAGVTASRETISGLQQRLELLLTEREQFLRHSREDAEQIERLTSRVLSLILPSGNLTAAGAAHDLRQSDLFRQIREEVVMRDRYAAWRQGRHPIVRDRPVTATRTIDEETAEGVLAVRRMHMFRPPQGFRGTARWVIEGVLLDPESERFLIEASRQRVAYREDMMAR